MSLHFCVPMNLVPKKLKALLGLDSAPAPQPAPAPQKAPEAAADQPQTASGLEAQRLLDQGKGAEALKLAQRVATEDGHLRGAQFLLGLCLDQVGRHEEALEAYEQELAKFPDHFRARQRLEALAKALVMPKPQQVPFEQRSWNTALPRETLLRMQQSLHNYSYRGVPMLKDPFDFALYPLLLWKLKPRTVIEIGSKSGGSAMWLADTLINFGLQAQVFSVDIVRVESVSHPRVTFLEGNGRALAESLTPRFLQALPRPWLVIEDADHAYETSSAVLRFFHPWLQPGEYIVIEDGIISDLAGQPDFTWARTTH